MGEYYVIRSGQSDELYHYGVKGMKWGVRKSYGSSNDVQSKKQAYKQAKKEYNKSFKTAYRKAGGAYSLSKTKRQENEERWEDVADKAENLKTKKQAYKQAKSGSKTLRKGVKSDLNNIDATLEYKRKKAEAKKLRNASRGAMVAGLIMRTVGQEIYDANKTNCSNGKLAAINALGYGSKALSSAGRVGVGASYIKQFSNYDIYRKKRIAELYR